MGFLQSCFKESLKKLTEVVPDPLILYRHSSQLYNENIRMAYHKELGIKLAKPKYPKTKKGQKFTLHSTSVVLWKHLSLDVGGSWILYITVGRSIGLNLPVTWGGLVDGRVSVSTKPCGRFMGYVMMVFIDMCWGKLSEACYCSTQSWVLSFLLALRVVTLEEWFEEGDLIHFRVSEG